MQLVVTRKRARLAAKRQFLKATDHQFKRGPHGTAGHHMTAKHRAVWIGNAEMKMFTTLFQRAVQCDDFELTA